MEEKKKKDAIEEACNLLKSWGENSEERRSYILIAGRINGNKNDEGIECEAICCMNNNKSMLEQTIAKEVDKNEEVFKSLVIGLAFSGKANQAAFSITLANAINKDVK